MVREKIGKPLLCDPDTYMHLHPFCKQTEFKVRVSFTFWCKGVMAKGSLRNIPHLKPLLLTQTLSISIEIWQITILEIMRFG